ncbi:MAG TPA: Rossmann fold nucleotide-binding protein [Nocardioidaceae bacterium]|nr:Rossmann fold nucleotide-binding protein [Nocardioidaceae bacterium]
MRHERGRTIEVESLEQFDALVADGATSMSGWHLQAVDLRDRAEVLARLSASGSLLLGCALHHDAEADLRARGALVFPAVPDTPVNPYRSSLYTPFELYEGLDRSYPDTLDARVYAWAQASDDLDRTLVQALHDHAVDDALRDHAGGRRLVGMMGGHALARGSEGYVEAARLAHSLTGAGLTVSTGGGPGAMEAANLGAYLGGYDPSVINEAVEGLARAPGFTPSIEEWARAAFEVLERWPEGRSSLGIPTWHYGHEPPNPFASHIAKYFKNAIREDVLLHVCSDGIVFLPGAGGTVQEIFQDACENYYADPATVAPMVLVGVEYWTRTLPASPLLETLARDRAMASVVHLVDDLSDVPPLLGVG